jgi:hypothetical protein
LPDSCRDDSFRARLGLHDAPEREMAQIKFITETGMFHVACRCEIKGKVEWYGFKPIKSMEAVYPGYVDRSDRSALINHWVTFGIEDITLQNGVNAARSQYTGAIYAVGVKDCVSFAADVARKIGLKVPRVNMTPYGFIKILEVHNRAVESA